jgi:glycosyltransferase involved in cell wall biosynthesis
MIVGKRILVLSPFPNWPAVNGSVTRTYHLVRHLSGQNSLYFVFRGSNQYTEPNFPCNAIPSTRKRLLQLFDPRMLTRLLHLIRQQEIDLIICSHLWSGLNGVLLKTLSKCPLLFDDHNVEYLRFRRADSPLWPLVRVLEWLVCRMADHVLCVSDHDMTHLVNHLGVRPDRVQVIENGADTEGLFAHSVDIGRVRRYWGIGNDELMLLFFGNLKYPPNQQAVGIILDEIVPRLVDRLHSFKVVIAGAGRYALPARCAVSANVIYAGFVDDLAALIKSADLIIAPLMAGSGTRLKIIESVACGRHVITTSMGIEGLDRNVLGGFVTICDDWDCFAARILETPSGLSPRSPGHDFVARYDWESILMRLHL